MLKFLRQIWWGRRQRANRLEEALRYLRETPHTPANRSEDQRRRMLTNIGNPSNWDWQHAEKKSPVPKSRVVVSVSLSGEQFDLIFECAERLGMSTSQFIREAAIDRVSGGPQVNITSVS